MKATARERHHRIEAKAARARTRRAKGRRSPANQRDHKAAQRRRHLPIPRPDRKSFARKVVDLFRRPQRNTGRGNR